MMTTKTKQQTLYIGANGLKYLDETAAAASLTNAQRPKAPLNVQARSLEVFMKLASLAPDKQAEHLDFLEKALKDSSVWKTAPDYSEQNRTSLKDAQKKKKPMPKLSKDIVSMFNSDESLSEDFKERAIEVFENAVGVASARAFLLEVFESDPIFQLMFADDDIIDRCQLMSDRILELEASCRSIELENAMLMRESALIIDEEVLFPSSPRSTRRSSRNLSDDFEADIENAVLMSEESRQGQGQYLSPAMARRAAFLQQIGKTNG
jgi:hypothetical protein